MPDSSVRQSPRESSLRVSTFSNVCLRFLRNKGRSLRDAVGIDRHTPANLLKRPPRKSVIPLRLLTFEPFKQAPATTAKTTVLELPKFSARGMEQPVLIESGSSVSALRVDVVEHRRGEGLRVVQVRIVHTGYEPLDRLAVELHELTPKAVLLDGHGPTSVTAFDDFFDLGVLRDIQPGTHLQWRIRTTLPEDAMPVVWLRATAADGKESTVLVELR